MKTYLLRDIPEELLKATKSKAAQEGRSIKDILLSSLETYTSRRFDPDTLPACFKEQTD